MLKEYLGYIVLAVTWLLSGAGLFYNTQAKIDSQKNQIEQLNNTVSKLEDELNKRVLKLEDELAEHKRKESERFERLIQVINDIREKVTILSTEFSILVKK